MIPEHILFEFNAEKISLDKGQTLFYEGKRADFYYQVIKGEIKMHNLTENGKEFIQGIFKNGKSFGEPPLFANFSYPAAASATKPTTLIRLSKEQFILLLKKYPEIHLELTSELCNRLGYKSMMIKEVSIHSPEHRILTLLSHLKKLSNTNNSLYIIELTRQQIAELTGLRVETVIRAIKKLEADKKLVIKNRKILM